MLRREQELLLLEYAGVDNWIGYDGAFDTEISETAEDYQQLNKMSDEEITKDYETFNKDNK